MYPITEVRADDVNTPECVPTSSPGGAEIVSNRFRREHVLAGLFLGGTGLSLTGNVMASIALPWFVLQTTGSAVQTGLTGMAAFLPAFLAGIFGGVLVDRLGGRRMSVISDIASGLAIFAIPVLYQTIGLSFTQLLVLVFLGALLDIPGVTARRTLLPRFAESARVRPEAMNSSFEVLGQIAGISGPALAGILIAPMGAVNLLWLTGAGFMISAAAVYGVVPAEKPRPGSGFSICGYAREIGEGLSFLRKDSLLLAMAIQFAVNNFVTTGFYSVALAVLVYDRFGDASRLGLLFSALSVGSLMGGTLYGVIGHRLRGHRRGVMLFGVVPQPFLMMAFVVDTPFILLLLSMFLIGLIAGPRGPLSVTVRLERIPEHLRGRVFSTFSAITAVISPLGMVGMGFAIERIGVSAAMFVATCIYAGIAIALPFGRSYREMNVQREAPLPRMDSARG